MEEIQALHNLNLEWGCITNLMDKISEIEDKLDEEELTQQAGRK